MPDNETGQDKAHYDVRVPEIHNIRLERYANDNNMTPSAAARELLLKAIRELPDKDPHDHLRDNFPQGTVKGDQFPDYDALS